MGSFSWLKADELTKVANVPYGHPFKFLIPEEFGGGFIKDKYQDYGYLGLADKDTPIYDMYELLAFWNREVAEKNGKKLKFNGKFNPMKPIDEHTDYNRLLGIDVEFSYEDVADLKYPLKLASASFNGKYEDVGPSYRDPEQGFYPVMR